MGGYFSGLSSPSVTDSSTTRRSSPKSYCGGTDEIADVLDDEEIQAGQVQLLQSAGHHVRFEMADRAGGDLHHRRAGLAQALGVVVGGQIADDDAGF